MRSEQTDPASSRLEGEFREVAVEIPEPGEVRCTFEDHGEESILWVTVAGRCAAGSAGAEYGQYLYQHIGLGLLKTQPLAVLVDLRELEYSYGDQILHLFRVFSDIRVYDAEFITAFVLSDRNRHGLASLLQFDLANPAPPVFYDPDRAYAFLLREYDTI